MNTIDVLQANAVHDNEEIARLKDELAVLRVRIEHLRAASSEEAEYVFATYKAAAYKGETLRIFVARITDENARLNVEVTNLQADNEMLRQWRDESNADTQAEKREVARLQELLKDALVPCANGCAKGMKDGRVCLHCFAQSDIPGYVPAERKPV